MARRTRLGGVDSLENIDPASRAELHVRRSGFAMEGVPLEAIRQKNARPTLQLAWPICSYQMERLLQRAEEYRVVEDHPTDTFGYSVDTS